MTFIALFVLSHTHPLSLSPSLLSLTDMPQSSSSKSVEKAKVTFEYEADNPDELTIKVGEIVEVVNKSTDNDGWWEVSLVCLFVSLIDCF